MIDGNSPVEQLEEQRNRGESHSVSAGHGQSIAQLIRRKHGEGSSRRYTPCGFGLQNTQGSCGRDSQSGAMERLRTRD